MSLTFFMHCYANAILGEVTTIITFLTFIQPGIFYVFLEKYLMLHSKFLLRFQVFGSVFLVPMSMDFANYIFQQ